MSSGGHGQFRNQRPECRSGEERVEDSRNRVADFQTVESRRDGLYTSKATSRRAGLRGYLLVAYGVRPEATNSTPPPG